MLILDRKAHEGFWIDGRIYVKVLDIGRRRVKIGIDAPADISIVREELELYNQGGGGDDATPAQCWLSSPIEYSVMQEGRHDYRKQSGQYNQLLGYI